MTFVPSSPAAIPRKRRGCFFYGCLTVVILAVLCGVAAFFAVRFALGRVQALAERYTETQPARLPQTEVSPEDYARLQQRVEAFGAALGGRGGVGSLVLTADDLNGLIANHPGLARLRGQLHVTIEGDQVKGQLSLPLAEWVKVPGLGSRLEGRYLNGAAALRVSLEAGALEVRLESLEVKGAPLPEEFLAGLRGQNLAADLAAQPAVADALRGLDRVEVRDGVVTLSARGAAGPAEAGP